MAKALQDCPKSGILLAEDILTCPKHAQKSKIVDALNRCANDPHVILGKKQLIACELDAARHEDALQCIAGTPEHITIAQTIVWGVLKAP